MLYEVITGFAALAAVVLLTGSGYAAYAYFIGARYVNTVITSYSIHYTKLYEIVGEESCVGERGTRNLTDDSGETVEALMDAITDRYFQVDCAIFTPNQDRLEHIMEMAEAYKADGVIHYGLQFVITSYSIHYTKLYEKYGSRRRSEDIRQVTPG